MCMQQIIDVDSCLQDPSMIAQEVSGFINADQANSIINPSQATHSIKKAEMSKYEMFI